jgi:hypothetical protein
MEIWAKSHFFPITIVLIFLIFSWQISLSQEEDLLESILQQLEDVDAENADWLEYFWELTENPLDLNQASEYDLARIPFLPQDIVDDVIRLRERKGGFESMDELLEIDDFSPELLEALKPFITVHRKFFSPKFIYRIQSRMESPPRVGFTNKFEGNRLYLQNRLLFNLNPNLDGAVIWEKDPGEGNYFDYGSWFVSYRHPNEKFYLLLGDYQLKIGSGLAFWSPYGSPLSARILPALPGTRIPFSGNRSTNEIGHLRGMASSYNIWRQSHISIFYSNNKVDATLSQEGNFVTSLYTTGLHRFDTELGKVSTLSESIQGLSYSITMNKTDVQLSAVRSDYRPAFLKLPDVIVHTGLTFIHHGEYIKPAGEYNLLNGKYPAFHQYLYFNGDRFKYEIAAYYYHPRYFAVRGRALGSFSGTPQNMSGAALMVWYQLQKSLILNGTVHIYNLFTRKDYRLEMLWKYGRNNMKVLYLSKYRENEMIAFPDPALKINGSRLELDFNLSTDFTLRNRLELRWAKPLEKNTRYYGTNLFQQIQFKPMLQTRFTLRWSVFDIPDYTLRIYEYEPDLPGNFRSMMLNGRGYKWFVLIDLKMSNIVQLDFKFQERYYPDLESVGSGPDQFNANRVRDFRLSFIWRY